MNLFLNYFVLVKINKPMNKKIIVTIIVIIIFVLIFYKLFSNKQEIDKRNNIEVKSTKVPVTVAKVIKKDIVQQLNILGTLAAEKELTILSETQGRITSLSISNGTYLSNGMLIATVEDELRQIAVKTAETAYEKAKLDSIRFQNLTTSNASPALRLQEVKLGLVAAEAQLRQAKRALNDTKIISHTNGMVVNKMVEVGSVLAPGAPIATIVDVSRLKVKLQVPEQDVYKLKLGDKINLITDIYPDVTFEGSISYISPKGDEAHNYPVEIAIINDGIHPLKAGTYITARFANIQKNTALTIPREALVGSLKDASVYVVENNKAILRKISIGTASGSQLEVINGLRENEIIIITGQINLTDKVEVLLVQ